jgi:hypothetical protein
VFVEELEHVGHRAGDDSTVIQSGHFLPFAVHGFCPFWRAQLFGFALIGAS